MRARVLTALVAIVALGGCGPAEAGNGAGQGRLGLGREVAAHEVAALDIDIGPDGVGLPPGSGSVAEGTKVYAAKCASCHGANGEGMRPAYPALVGRPPEAEQFKFGSEPGLERTIGNYWPYATTVFDYVRRSMPQMTPGSLTDNEVYALTAYLLSANEIIAKDATLDAESLKKVEMPDRDRFVPDNRRGGREVK